MQENTAKWTWEEKLMLAGFGIGLAIFMLIGVVPALVYGGYTALGLLSEMFGPPVAPTLAARAFIAVGMLLSVIAMGSLFAVLGGIFGLLMIGTCHAVGLIVHGARDTVVEGRVGKLFLHSIDPSKNRDEDRSRGTGTLDR